MQQPPAEPVKPDEKAIVRHERKKSKDELDAIMSGFNFPVGPTTTQSQPKK